VAGSEGGGAAVGGGSVGGKKACSAACCGLAMSNTCVSLSFTNSFISIIQQTNPRSIYSIICWDDIGWNAGLV